MIMSVMIIQKFINLKIEVTEKWSNWKVESLKSAVTEYHTQRIFFMNLIKSNKNENCNYSFSIHLAPIVFPFVNKSIGKGLTKPKFILI